MCWLIQIDTLILYTVAEQEKQLKSHGSSSTWPFADKQEGHKSQPYCDLEVPAAWRAEVKNVSVFWSLKYSILISVLHSSE